jgi:hypothetical protein
VPTKSREQANRRATHSWVMGYIRVREAEVPPLPGLSCHYRFCFPGLPPWAALSRPSGTPGNMELVRYPLLKTIDREFRFVVPTATAQTSINTTSLGGDPASYHIGPQRC